MADNILEYKGYLTKVEYSAEDRLLHGKIEGIRDLITFQCASAEAVEREFHTAVDDYLAFCADIGQTPDKTYRGQFNVRIPEELHRQAAIAALKQGESLNSFVTRAISAALQGPPAVTRAEVHYHVSAAASDLQTLWQASSKGRRLVIYDA